MSFFRLQQQECTEKTNVFDEKQQAELKEALFAVPTRSIAPIPAQTIQSSPPVIPKPKKTECKEAEREAKHSQKKPDAPTENFEEERIDNFMDCNDYAGLLTYFQRSYESYIEFANKSSSSALNLLERVTSELQQRIGDMQDVFSSEIVDAEKVVMQLKDMAQFAREIVYETEANDLLDRSIDEVRREVNSGKRHPEKLEITAELTRSFNEHPDLASIFVNAFMQRLDQAGMIDLIHSDLLGNLKELLQESNVMAHNPFHQALTRLIDKMELLNLTKLSEEEQVEHVTKLSLRV